MINLQSEVSGVVLLDRAVFIFATETCSARYCDKDLRQMGSTPLVPSVSPLSALPRVVQVVLRFKDAVLIIEMVALAL